METLVVIVLVAGMIYLFMTGRRSARDQPSPAWKAQIAQATGEVQLDEDEQRVIDRELSVHFKDVAFSEVDPGELRTGLASTALYQMAKARFQQQDMEGAFDTCAKSLQLADNYEGPWLLYAEAGWASDAEEALRVAEETAEQNKHLELLPLPELPSVPGIPRSNDEMWAGQVAAVREKIKAIK